MGVPALFRWLSDKYEKIVIPVVEEAPKKVDDVEIPIDISKPNPNGMEFDNLYLDMNGIIHPCCHPEGKPAPETEDDMMVEIFKYMDRIVNMIRPRKVLYLAIDGVAPRAKMNQQRSRRFRAAQVAKIQMEEDEKIRKQIEESGHFIAKKEKKEFDSNCITPGTPFMAHLATSLRYHVAYKLNTDPGWKNLKVILSDANVPGEGEHKIMNYIRAQRTCPEHDPNTSHVIYGLDADLIMLALATHEPHFKVLREDVFFKEGKVVHCRICGQKGHYAENCTGAAKEKNGEYDEKGEGDVQKPFIFLDVGILREYLEIELSTEHQPFPFDLERAIDDWVFLCFFVGNDFLPHLPSLEIREGAIDTLITLWKKSLPLMGGYMTNNGNIDLKKVQYIVQELGSMEDEIFINRKEREERIERANKRRKLREEANNNYVTLEATADISQTYRVTNFSEASAAPVKGTGHIGALSNHDVVTNRAALRMANMNAAQLLKAELATSTETSINETLTTDTKEENTNIVAGVKRKSVEHDLEKPSEEEDIEEDTKDEEVEVEEVEEEAFGIVNSTPIKPLPKNPERVQDQVDNVRLWEPGFKERYYRDKFGVELNDYEFRRKIVHSYVEGLCWVLKYYYQGCPSWKWYYAYHYAPFASDFVDIGNIEINFELGEPFRPLEQLMGVLPAASRDHLPPAFHSLMCDPESEIIDFYPEDFKLDLNGKKFDWQAVVILPFIEEHRFLKALEQQYPKLTDEEIMRNTLGKEILIFSENNKLYDSLSLLYTRRNDDQKVKLNPHHSNHMSGYASRDPNCIPRSTLPSPLPNNNLPDIVNDKSLSVIYELPEVDSSKFVTSLLKGVKLKPRVLTPEDVYLVRTGRNNRRGRGRGHGGYRPQELRSQRDTESRDNSYPSLPRGQYDRSPNSPYGADRDNYSTYDNRRSRSDYDSRRNYTDYSDRRNYSEFDTRQNYSGHFRRDGPGSYGGYEQGYSHRQNYEERRHTPNYSARSSVGYGSYRPAYGESTNHGRSNQLSSSGPLRGSGRSSYDKPQRQSYAGSTSGPPHDPYHGYSGYSPYGYPAQGSSGSGRYGYSPSSSPPQRGHPPRTFGGRPPPSQHHSGPPQSRHGGQGNAPRPRYR
ncbi:uncharacterized protein VTP21DRAFT_2385 [Calcarisporiella thermophila]|uniref:uncharacterized protein n=1 Tax=Calcarisporiella thermophila TaxID=911321 RepID=UPI0037427D00